MAFNCPNCNEVMYPNDDGCCPFCIINVRLHEKGKKVKNEPPIIVLKHEQLLPPICYKCGNQSDTYIEKKIGQTIGNNKSTLKNIIQVAFIIIGIIIFPIFIFRMTIFRDNSRYFKVHIRMPVCKSCKKSCKLEPHYVDVNSCEVSFVVHENLKREFEKTGKYISYRK